jgi:hypothetical protein
MFLCIEFNKLYIRLSSIFVINILKVDTSYVVIEGVVVMEELND